MHTAPPVNWCTSCTLRSFGRGRFFFLFVRRFRFHAFDAAEQVAAAIMKGIRKGTPVVYPEFQTRFLSRLANGLPRFTRWYLDRVVARARRKRLRG